MPGLGSDGRAPKWPKGFAQGTAWTTYNGITITFNDRGGNLVCRESALILESDSGDEVFCRGSPMT